MTHLTEIWNSTTSSLPPRRTSPRRLREQTDRTAARLRDESPSCCWDLNPGPRPYQGRALPLSHSSTSCACPMASSGRTEQPRRARRRPAAFDSAAADAHASSAVKSAPIYGNAQALSSSRSPKKAGDGNRTHMTGLEGQGSTIELRPPALAQVRPPAKSLDDAAGPRAEMGGGGFEPPKATPADLQSAPFDRSGIRPTFAQPRELTERFELSTC